jgi:DNA helicase-2/ATP-dependent DNA helicase PcrA
MRAVIPKILPDIDFEIEGALIMEIREIKIAILREYAFMPVSRRLDKLKAVLEVRLKNRRDFIAAHIENTYEKEKESIKARMPDSEERRQIITELLDERDEKQKQLKKQLRTAVKDYMNKFKLFTPLKYYELLFERPSLIKSLAKDIYTEEEAEILASGKELTTEDLAPLLYIHNYIHGDTEGNDPVKLAVIDEAQDISPFQLWAMRNVCKDAYFSLLGDLNQGIYSHRGFNSWDEAHGIFEGRSTTYMTLSQSYRTTVEIMDAANEVIGALNNDLPKAVPVIRRGPRVSVIEYPSLKQVASAIEEQRESMKEMGYRSFAIICKTMNECERLRKELSGDVTIVTGAERDYIGGVMLIPSYLVKGLEFDLCCIANASGESLTNSALDIKLLYVAMTRALHELVIFSIGKKTPLLANCP